MPTFRRCDETVTDLAASVLQRFETHAPIISAKLRIDYVFGFADRDEGTGEKKNDALTIHGCRALGITRKIGLKDRALGRGDAEIALDGDWWNEASEEERAALLDHELHHIVVSSDTDDLGRHKVKMRAHDYEFGWFRVVAARNGLASQERIQAAKMMEDSGQYFWPSITAQLGHGTETASRRLELHEVAR